MRDQEERRSQIVARLVSGHLTYDEAEELLRLSSRQVRRLVRSYKESGALGLVHGNRGRSPAHRTAPAIATELLQLAGKDGLYHDFNVCHMHDLLTKQGIRIGRSTLDRLLRQSGVRKRRRGRPVAVHKRREPMPSEGMLLQIDGSPHDWLEGRSPSLCLIGAIDDATSRVCYARFHPTECQEAYLLLMRTVALTHGLPMSFYHDRHTILRSPKKQTIEDELEGRVPMSQLQRVMDRLGVESIAAQSPQAKGRVERLWQTFQDRLIKEMRLARVNTMEEANAFLPGFLEDFNAQFSHQAKDPQTAWVTLEPDTDLAYLFAVVEERVVKKDHTLSFQGNVLLLTDQVYRAGHRVAVHRTPEQEIFVYAGKQRLECRQIEKTKAPKAELKNDGQQNDQRQASMIKDADAKDDRAQETTRPSDRQGSRGWLYAKAA